MAYSQPQAQSNQADTSWKATAFINLWVPGATPGSKVKVGDTGIALKLNRKTDAAIIDRLTKGGPEALAAMREALTIDFKLVDDPAAGPVKLGF